MRHDKLVRDRIPDIIRSKGETFSFHIATDAEYVEKLYAKLFEGAYELSDGRNIAEIADVLEVLDAIATFEGLSWEECLTEKCKKPADRGGFSDRIILDESWYG